jgi:hypothetical protein
LDWGFLADKRTHKNLNIEWPQWDFGFISVVLCQCCLGAVVYVDTKCVLEVKLLSVPKKDPGNILLINEKVLSYRIIYFRVFRHRKDHA